MKRRLALLLAAVWTLSACILPVFAGDTVTENDAPAAENISVSAYAAILVDMDTGDTLYAYNADEQNYPASTTKIMTAYLCLKYGDPKDTVTVSSSAFSDISQRASTGGLVVGETMTVHRLLQALLVVSASEAANVVGEYISGTHEEFVDLMNEEAQALGCTGTHFANCHGLPNSDHYTTAGDLSIIARAAMEYQEFRDIVGSAKTVMEATNKHSRQTITSTNGLLPGSAYPTYSYPYAIGVKTGHTSVAGYCLVSAASKDGRELLCVVMGCGSRTSSFSQSRRLFEWGYENYDALTYGKAVEAPELPDPEVTEDPLLEGDEAPMPEETVSPSASPVAKELTVPAPSPSPTVETAPAVSAAGSNAEGMLSVLVCFGIAALLLVLLIVVVVVLIVRRK